MSTIIPMCSRFPSAGAPPRFGELEDFEDTGVKPSRFEHMPMSSATEKVPIYGWGIEQ